MSTPRENLFRSIRKEGFETVPIDPNSFCPSQVEAFKRRFGHDDYHAFFNSPVRCFGTTSRQDFREWRRDYYSGEELPEDISFDSFGVGHSKQAGCFHMTRMHHPLRGEDVTVGTIEKYPFPQVDLSRMEEAARNLSDIHSKGLAGMFCMACTVWETAWYMRSMEDLMGDMMQDDARAEILLDRVTEFSCGRGRFAAGLGTDIIQLGDDIGMQSSIMMSVELWRKWLKPRLARVIGEIRSVKPDVFIFYHSCGYVLPFLEELAEIGVDILNPVQPECMDFEEVHRRIGERMSFRGTIGTQKVLPFGTPEDVRRQVERNLRICGDKGGIVIGPTHMVEPEVPWENLLAMKEAVENFRACSVQ